jgi:PKD repeat protein
MKKIVSIVLVLSIILSNVLMILPQVKAHDLPDELHLGYYITPNDAEVINVAQIICGSDFGKTDFWTVRSNVENLYHWVAGSVPHGIPKNIHYMNDQDYWGVPDYWQLSNTTLNLKHGDDEDQAILLASLIKAAGVQGWRVRIAKYGVYRLEFPWWGFGLVKIEKERLGCYYAVEVYDISSHPTNLWYHDWWTPLHPLAENLLGWPLPFASCEWLGNLAFENPICARRLKPERYFYEWEAEDPTARFTHFPETPSVNETVKFDASTSTPDGGDWGDFIWKHSWDFGDGIVKNVTNSYSIPPPPVFHAFESEGNFMVTLTVFDTEARSNSTSKVIQVHGLPDTTPPDIVITSPQNMTYTTGTIDLNYTVSEPTSWVGCTIDDGEYVSNETITGNTTLYFTEGSHNIQLFANDTSGNMGASEKIYFTVELPPVANFTWSPHIPEVGESVTFDASASTPNGGTIVEYDWSFGDGEYATGQIVAHVYSSPGTYIVTLNVTDSEGLWDVEEKQIQIISEYTLTIHSIPSGVTFTVDSVSHTTSWSGTYDEGTSVSLVMPETHTIGDAKYYWSQWSDGVTSRSRTVTMDTDITLTGQFTGPYYELTVTSSPITGILFTINGISHTTPYTEMLPEDPYILEMPETHNGYVWFHWLEDGDTNRMKTITLPGTTWTGVYKPKAPPAPVGGVWVPINKFELLAPWITLASLITVAALSIVYAKHKKKQQS